MGPKQAVPVLACPNQLDPLKGNTCSRLYMNNLVRVSYSSHPRPQRKHMFIRSWCVFVVTDANGMPSM